MSNDPSGVMASIDDEVRRFTATNLEREGVVTGWVLCIASSRFDEDGDICYAYDYSVGPDTDMMRAVGLVELCRDRMKRDCAGGDE